MGVNATGVQGGYAESSPRAGAAVRRGSAVAAQGFGTGTSLTGVIVLVQRWKAGQRNRCRAFTSSASTTRNNVCCAFAPYRPTSLTPGTDSSNSELEPPSSRGHELGCVDLRDVEEHRIS